jgi:ABC-2 type transport system permease protein
MAKPYSQSKALWSITKASFTAIFAQPVAIVFSLLFPIIFILIFGAFGNRGGPSYSIGIAPGTDTTTSFYDSLTHADFIRVVKYPDTASMYSELRKGRLTAVLGIRVERDTALAVPDSLSFISDPLRGTKFRLSLETTPASGNTFGAFRSALYFFKLSFEASVPGNIKRQYVYIERESLTQGKRLQQIDFILPGQVGFSILFSTLFGIAFTFYTLREQLVLKRFYASPVKKIHILIGIGVSRLFFQLINVVVLILFGYFFLDFTLQNGFLTILEMLVLSTIMLFLLMGVGLIFSSIVKSDAPIPLLINLFGFPQMLLSGTFFPITVFPPWLQSICKILPLTQFNDAIRKISFEGLHLYDVWKEIGILGIWIAVIYVVLVRVIKWE